MKHRIVVIVQARMGSSRFPGKSMELIDDKPVLWHVLHRAKRIRLASDVVLAIPHTRDNDCLERLGLECGVSVHRGSDKDVLARYYSAAEMAEADWIVRVTGDCPLLDPKICDAVIAKAVSLDADYLSNTWPIRTVASGFDCEVFRFDTLYAAHHNAKDPYEREHVTPWMQRMIFEHEHGPKLSVDTPEDLERVKSISCHSN